MSEKENTKKERFSYKKGKKNSRFSSEGQSYLYSRHTGGLDHLTDYKGLIYHFYEPRFIYFAETDDEYKYMNENYSYEIQLLIKDEIKYFYYPDFLKNQSKTKDMLKQLEKTEEYEKFVNDFTECLIQINGDKYPVIKWILNSIYKKSDFNGNMYYMEVWNEEKLIKNIIENTIQLSQDFKNFIKILGEKDAQFLIRSEYYGKSENAKQNKSRRWRKNIETNRRRKERRERKNNIKNHY